jgi:dihydroorotate dehydrogenase
MPDWSYHPLLRPLTDWLPTPVRRALALRGLRAVAALPGGPVLVDFLGDMKPDPSLVTAPYGKPLCSPIGVGGGVDPDALAIGALGRFGFGFVEVGPYAIGAATGRGIVPPPLSIGLQPAQLGTRLRSRPSQLSVWLRLLLAEDDAHAVLQVERMLDSVDGAVDVVVVSMLEPQVNEPGGDDRSGSWPALLNVCREHGISTVLVDAPISGALSRIHPAFDAGASGVVVRGPINRGEENGTRRTMEALRRGLPAGALIVAGGGAWSPRDIVEAFSAGADLVAVDQGFIEAGPGLAKRGNEALVAIRGGAVSTTRALAPVRGINAALRSGWLWLVLLGLGMLVAGGVVFWVGLTRVLLPYDEAFLGSSRDALSNINPRLVGFMRHDRITLAGTLMSIGILYASLAWYGARQGRRWARAAVLGSGIVGFASLFLFLGFHYVDPLHVALSAGLFPLFLLGILLPTHGRSPTAQDLDNDATWRLGLVGQLLFIGLAGGLIVAGATITTVGVTRVFVFSDLQFLQTTATAVGSANAHLMPLIAHDRAGFGGALASDGVALLLLSLWGFRRGERWVWWTLLCAGLIGLSGGVYAHIAVGYLEFGHLLPLAASGIVFVAALVLSSRFLLARRA